MEILNAIAPYFTIILMVFAIFAMVLTVVVLFGMARRDYLENKKTRLECEHFEKCINQRRHIE